MKPDGPTVSPTVLVVEDEFLIAMLLVDELRTLGWTVIGPVGDLDSARRAADALSFDIAVLDINLRGEMSFPVAEQLARRGIPYLFLTGYTDLSVPPTFRSVPLLHKPSDPSEVAKRLEQLLNEKASGRRFISADSAPPA